MNIIELTADLTTQVANSGAFVFLTATVKDDGGRPVPGATVNWGQLPTTHASFDSPTSFTDVSGAARMAVSNSQPEIVRVTASTELGVQASITISFVPLEVGLVLAASTTTVPADGVTVVTLTAITKYSDGSPASNRMVNWVQTSTTHADFTLPVSITDANGIAIVTLTNTQSEVVTVKAHIRTGSFEAVSAPMSIHFTPAPQPDKITLSVSQDHAQADGKSAITLTATVTDNQNNPMKHTLVTWGQNVNGSAPLPPYSITNEHGVATAVLTSYTPRQLTVYAISNYTQSNGQFVTFNAVVGPVSVPNYITMSVSPSRAPADGMSAIILTARVTDAQNNPVKDSVVNWSQKPADAAMLPTSTKTDEHGIATSSVTSITSGLVVLSAFVSGTNLRSELQTVTFDPAGVGAVPAHITLSASPSHVPADGRTAIALTAKVTDNQGNPVKGSVVNWSQIPVNAATLPGSSTTDELGIATASVTSLTSGQVVLSASISGTNLSSGLQTVTFDPVELPGTVPANITLVANQTAAAADGVTPVTLTATVRDVNGAEVPNASVTWHQEATTGAHFLSPVSTTNASGVATVTVTDTRAETVSVTASVVSGSQTLTSLPVTLTFTSALPGTVPVNLVLEISAGSFDNASADGHSIISLTATVTDASHHPVPGVALQWTADNSSTVKFMSGAQDVTDQNGKMTVTLTDTTIENTTITAVYGHLFSSTVVHFLTPATSGYVIQYIPGHTVVFDDGSQGVRVDVQLIDAVTRKPAPAGFPVNWVSQNPERAAPQAPTTRTDQNGKTFNNINPSMGIATNPGGFILKVSPENMESNSLFIPLSRHKPLAEPVINNANTPADHNLSQQDINDGVVINIPHYNDEAPGDTIAIYWGGFKEEFQADTFFNVYHGTFDVAKGMPAEALSSGFYTVYYTVMDASGNLDESKSILVSVSNDMQKPVFPAPELFFNDAPNTSLDSGTTINEQRSTFGMQYRIPVTSVLSGDIIEFYWQAYDQNNSNISDGSFQLQGIAGKMTPVDEKYFSLPDRKGYHGYVKCYYTISRTGFTTPVKSAEWTGLVDTQVPS